MTPRSYYNEHEKFAAQWLRELIIIGEIADGDVDERSIVDVTPGDLHGYTQCHFFAGIGGWSHALRLAGWGDDRAVWTGSCPCQPFSSAGQQKGFNDPRHLYPVWSRLLRECRPPVVFGEQVASQLSWLDLVSGDLENEGYAVGTAIVGAHSVGAPHIRQRLYFGADTDGARCGSRGTSEAGDGRDAARVEPSGLRVTDCVVVADAHNAGSQRRRRDELPERADQFAARASGASGELANPRHGSGRRRDPGIDRAAKGVGEHNQRPEDATPGFWSACDWLPCLDGKLRPVEPGTFPLVAGLPGRVGRLRGYGNSIVAPVAAAFIRSYLEARQS